MKMLTTDIKENLKLAVDTLRTNKLRSFLTVVGVVIGVWTVMAIASIISGIDVAVKAEVESFGIRSIFIYKFDPGFRTTAPTREERMRKDLTYDDALAIASLPGVELAVPNLVVPNSYFGETTTVTVDGKSSASIRLEGTLPDYARAGIWMIREGRFFTSFENDSNRQVCVVAANIGENFFPSKSPLGQTLKIGGREFRVIGTLEKREQLLFSGEGDDDFNNTIFIPFNVARRIRPGARDIYVFAVARPGQMKLAQEQISDLLRVRREVGFQEPNNFGIATAQSVTEQFHSITLAVAIAMIVISSVGLMVGGIGVMNIMLVSVTERTREIGTRKAIGARRRDILLQFLIEAMTLTGIGGLIGLALGWATTFVINLFIPSYVPLWAPVGGFMASISIGLIFGIWPAMKAARLNPIDALRYE